MMKQKKNLIRFILLDIIKKKNNLFRIMILKIQLLVEKQHLIEFLEWKKVIKYRLIQIKLI